MKQFLMVVSALAVTTLFAQSSDLEKLEASIAQVMQDGGNTQGDAPKTDVPDSKDGKKDLKEEENASEPKDAQSE